MDIQILKDSFLFTWQKSQDYGNNLVNDIKTEDMVMQNKESLNHPAWILSHLNAYLEVIEALCLGKEFPDPKNHPFGMQSKPEPNLSLYPNKEELLDSWNQGHNSVKKALENLTEQILAGPIPLERWKDKMPSVLAGLHFLMDVHENIHLGQLSAWRRIHSFPRV